jgi:Ca-activated chloride channel family protein
MHAYRRATPILLATALVLGACEGSQSGGDSAAAADTAAFGGMVYDAPVPSQEEAVPAAAPMDTAGLPPAAGHVEVGQPVTPPDGPNTEEYAVIRENEFRLASREPLSTFGIDVDAASYANVRRFLAQGQLPPAGAVRIEELVNYFDYEYADPAGPRPFTVTSEISAAPWNRAHRLVHVGIQGKRMQAENLPASNLVFLVDVSGSMDEPAKLPLVQQSLRMLVEQLRDRDRVAIVVYAGAAGMVLPSTPGSHKAAILRAIDGLRAGGSTAGGEGIEMAYRVARDNLVRGGNNRVILATDGDFNVGVSSDAELVRIIEEKRREGIFLTVLGYGTGNYKDGKMEQLADHGNGNYAYVDDLREARKVLVEEMGGTLLAIAKDVKVQVEFNPSRVRAYRLIGYENRALAAQDFNDDRKDAGELGAGHSVTALYEIIPAGSDEPIPGVDPLRYQQTRTRPGAARTDELLTVKLRYKDPRGETSQLIERPLLDRGVALERTSADFRFSAAVAEWGMLLRQSRHRGDATYDGVLRLARGAMGSDPNGHRADFVRLVDASRRMALGQPAPDLEDMAGDY